LVAAGSAGAWVAAPPQAVKSMLATNSKLERNSTDLRIFFSFNIIFEWVILFLCGENLRTILQVFLRQVKTTGKACLFVQFEYQSPPSLGFPVTLPEEINFLENACYYV
jgi:hypothetical protein